MTRAEAQAVGLGRHRIRVVLVVRADDDTLGVTTRTALAGTPGELRAAAHRLVDRVCDRLAGLGPARDAE